MQRTGGGHICDAYWRRVRAAAALALIVACFVSGCSADQPMTSTSGSLSRSSSPTDLGAVPTATLPRLMLNLVVCNTFISAKSNGMTHSVEVVVTTGRRIDALHLPNAADTVSERPALSVTFPPDKPVVMALARGDYHSRLVFAAGDSASVFPPARFDAFMTFQGVDGNPIEQTPEFESFLGQPVVPAPDLSLLGSVQTVAVRSETAACAGIG